MAQLWGISDEAKDLIRKSGLPLKLGIMFWLLYGYENRLTRKYKRQLGRAIRRGKLPKPPNLRFESSIEIPGTMEDVLERMSKECEERP